MLEHKVNDHEKRICNVEHTLENHDTKITQMEKRDIYLSTRMKQLCDRLDKLISVLQRGGAFIAVTVVGLLAFLLKYIFF